MLEPIARPLHSLLASVIAVSGVACSGSVDPERAGAVLPGSAAFSTRQFEAVCPTGGAPTDDDSALWLQSYDGPEISGLSANADGSAIVARSGAETLKLDGAGRQLWSKPYGSLVATDEAGDVYVAGTFEGTLTLDGRELVAENGRDVFVVELDPDGVVTAAVALGSNGAGEAVTSLVLDAQRNVVVSGDALGTIKLDAAWNIAWRTSVGGSAAVDENGRIWLSGGLIGTRDFGGTTLTSNGGSDVFVAQLAADGSLLMARRFGDAGALQRGESIAVADGAVVIAGTFDGSLDFGAGALQWTGCSTDAWCRTFGFVAQLAADGSANWSKSLGPMRSVASAAAGPDGLVALSGALPGGVRPFRQSWLLELDRTGEEHSRRTEWPETGIGAGHGVTFDGCGRLLWSLSARPSLDAEERTYLAKL